MRNWTGCSNFSILFLSLLIFIAGVPRIARSQSVRSYPVNDHYISRTNWPSYPKLSTRADTTQNDVNSHLPDPKSVMHKSMIIPGWGQIVNRQVWKVPLVYGLLGGLAYYSVYLTQKYHDYRAAYYNLNPQQTNNDFRFGPTPAYISKNANVDQLKTIRNTYKNRRDMVYIGIALAYGLNVIDAYVYANMRSFDVSKNLSVRPNIHPGITNDAAPTLTLSVDLITK